MISVLCPTLNEEDHIESVLRFFAESEIQDKELLIIDGGSTDKTRSIVDEYSSRNGNIVLVDNPKRFVSFALNEGIRRSKGEVIVRLDAHTKYDKHYLKNIMRSFANVEASIVGGPTRTAFKGSFQEAVAYCICTPFAIGDSKVHQLDFEGYTDSVTFGAWKKEIFEETGLFDEDLIRNQDDEFHYRARSKGFKIYQDPEIKLWYYPRSSLSGLIKQYFQYGLYKPLVLKKVKSEVKLRHLVPSIFVAYVLSIPLFAGMIWYFLPLLLYVLLDIKYSFVNKISIKAKLQSLIVYPAIHLSYGSGFIVGLGKVIK